MSGQNILKPKIGNKPTDFYYKLTSNARKNYYSKITGKKVTKGEIPLGLIDQIMAMDDSFEILKLVDQKKQYCSKISQLQTQIDHYKQKILEIDLKLSKVTDDEIYDLYERQQRQAITDKERIRQYEAEEQAAFEELLRKYAAGTNPPKDLPKMEDSLKIESLILQKFNINDKNQWKKWLLINHPDKGGQVLICQEIISAGRQQGW